jgi:tetratricopeptide (TPR) repeat protein
VARETGARNHQPIVFNNIGEALRIIGRYDEALEHYQPALEVARELGERLEQARAHDGIAHIMRATDQPDQARTHWEQALAIYTTLGSPLATQIQAHLEQRDLGVSRAQPFRSV